MKKCEAFIFGVASIFCFPNSTNAFDAVITKYPKTYEEDNRKAIAKAWIKVGDNLKGAINKYETEIKNATK